MSDDFTKVDRTRVEMVYNHSRMEEMEAFLEDNGIHGPFFHGNWMAGIGRNKPRYIVYAITFKCEADAVLYTLGGLEEKFRERFKRHWR